MFEGASCTVNSEEPAGAGVPGLDDILGGGLSRGRVFLLEGLPGTGKTTVAMQFLLEGARNGEKVLYLTLSESEEELRAAAAAHGWAFDGVEIVELISPIASLTRSSSKACFTCRTSSWWRRPGEYSKPSRDRSPTGWSSTASRK
jgi:KaiC/GvpD/RAD55 family RecA-like ATPase